MKKGNKIDDSIAKLTIHFKIVIINFQFLDRNTDSQLQPRVSYYFFILIVVCQGKYTNIMPKLDPT